MSCYQLYCVAVGFVRGEGHKAIVELLKAQVDWASSLSQKNIKELSLLFINVRNVGGTFRSLMLCFHKLMVYY